MRFVPTISFRLDSCVQGRCADATGRSQWPKNKYGLLGESSVWCPGQQISL